MSNYAPPKTIRFHAFSHDPLYLAGQLREICAINLACENPIIANKSLEINMRLKTIAIGLNLLLLLLCVGFFIGHGLPKSLMLWSSAILWFVAPMVNLLYIRKTS